MEQYIIAARLKPGKPAGLRRCRMAPAAFTSGRALVSTNVAVRRRD
jgi:hypothetical protein